MATTSPTRRTFAVAFNNDDGLIRISSAATGRVSLALSVEEASQIRSGLKELTDALTRVQERVGALS